MGEVSLGQCPALGCHLSPCLTTYSQRPLGSHRAECRPKVLLPVSTPQQICLLYVTQGKHALSLQFCVPPCPQPPKQGASTRFVFLGYTSCRVSLVAKKGPGPHWTWFLTSSPSSSSEFPHCTPWDWCHSWTPILPPSLFLTGISSKQLHLLPHL